MLIKKDWKNAKNRANTFPDEASTWIVTKGFNGNLRFLPLHKACVLSPPKDVVDTLLNAYVDAAKQPDQDGWLPLHCATFYGASEPVIETLIKAYPKATQTKDDDGRLPLHYACIKLAPQGVIDMLIKSNPKGAMTKDNEGRLPIHHACSKGAVEGVIDSLLKAAPKAAQSKDDQGRLPLHHACRKNSSDRIIRTLLRVYPRAAQIKDDQDKLPIHYSCQHGGSANSVSFLLTAYPESINVKNGFGSTPLMEAQNSSADNPKMKDVVGVLKKHKRQHDKLTGGGGDENAVRQDGEIHALRSRVKSLEKTLAGVIDLGNDIKKSLRKGRDAEVVLDKFADKLSKLEVGAPSERGNKSRGRSSSRGRVPQKESNGLFGRGRSIRAKE